MFRKLMLSTAIVALTAGGAYAQTQPAEPAPAPAQAQQPAAQPPMIKPISEGVGHLAANLIGENVYESEASDAKKIGDVNDIVIGPDGKVTHLVIGVGGFLGIGEKNVAVDFNTVEVAERTGDRWLIVKTTKEQLEAAAAFDTMPYAITTETAAAPAPAAPAATDTAQAPAEQPAAEQPATDTAQAPAEQPATETAQAPAEQPAATDAQETAAVDKSTMTPLPATDISAEKLTGTSVFGANDERIGEIGDVLATDGKVDAVVLDVGGFLGVGEKPVAVSMDNLAFMTDKDGKTYLYTTFTKEQLEAHPAYDAATFAEQRDQQLLKM